MSLNTGVCHSRETCQSLFYFLGVSEQIDEQSLSNSDMRQISELADCAVREGFSCNSIIFAPFPKAQICAQVLSNRMEQSFVSAEVMCEFDLTKRPSLFMKNIITNNTYNRKKVCIIHELGYIAECVQYLQRLSSSGRIQSHLHSPNSLPHRDNLDRFSENDALERCREFMKSAQRKDRANTDSTDHKDDEGDAAERAAQRARKIEEERKRKANEVLEKKERLYWESHLQSLILPIEMSLWTLLEMTLLESCIYVGDTSERAFMCSHTQSFTRTANVRKLRVMLIPGELSRHKRSDQHFSVESKLQIDFLTDCARRNTTLFSSKWQGMRSAFISNTMEGLATEKYIRRTLKWPFNRSIKVKLKAGVALFKAIGNLPAGETALVFGPAEEIKKVATALLHEGVDPAEEHHDMVHVQTEVTKHFDRFGLIELDYCAPSVSTDPSHRTRIAMTNYVLCESKSILFNQHREGKEIEGKESDNSHHDHNRPKSQMERYQESQNVWNPTLSSIARVWQQDRGWTNGSFQSQSERTASSSPDHNENTSLTLAA